MRLAGRRPFPFGGRDRQPEAAGLADADVEVGEVREHLLDLVADAVVVGDHALPVDGVSGSVARARPATIAGSERSSSEAGFRLPREACTIDIESSTVTDCGPPACSSTSVRPRQGRM